MRPSHTCRFCADYPQRQLHLRNSQDVADYTACFDARFPPFWLKVQALYSAMGAATGWR